VSGSTGIATTAIVDIADDLKSDPACPAAPYRGRFAPSPTGSLHFGSLVAALGSFLDARHHGGRWLLRIEDLDTARVIPGCADQILRTLETFGLLWDGDVVYQSHHIRRYKDALDELRRKKLTFECSCSRRLRRDAEDSGYPGTCREKLPGPPPTATRFRIEERQTVRVDDRFQGKCLFELRSLGDVVIRRRDGVIGYQLAVVVDDAAQKINYVVRGADLLASTPWQLSLQSALDIDPPPAYAHLPLITEPDGSKLAKSRRSMPLEGARAAALLLAALELLGQNTPAGPGIELEAPASILNWSIEHWNPQAFHGIRALPAPAI
jgi:glutamyl-Q tRNA(Asp) synthetase